VLRREALAALLAPLAARGASGCALLMDVATKRMVESEGGEDASRQLLPPGSTIKPFVLWGLLRSGKLRADEPLPCRGDFNCSHPAIPTPLTVATALAYSCNSFVAHAAERFAPGDLAMQLARAGFRAGRAASALGTEGVFVTPVELAMAYRTLALRAAPAVLEGLEGAVEFGTAQRARVPGLAVAGKTGTVRTAAGSRVAWFAGFAPSRKPQVVAVVMAPGLAGGVDAAPVAARMLEAWKGRR
jgi:penicillin-binding protein 2